MALIEIRVAAVQAVRELTRKGGDERGFRLLRRCKAVEVEEGAGQRLALIVDGMAPGIRGLPVKGFLPEEDPGDKGRVIGTALISAVIDVIRISRVQIARQVIG